MAQADPAVSGELNHVFAKLRRVTGDHPGLEREQQMLELLVVHFLVPWPTVRWVLFVLSLYGILWVLGFSAATVVWPHVIGPDRLHVRFAHIANLNIPLELVETAWVGRRDGYRRIIGSDRGILTIASGGSTDVSVRLREPYAYTATVRPGRREQVEEIRFPADEPAKAVAATRTATSLGGTRV